MRHEKPKIWQTFEELAVVVAALAALTMYGYSNLQDNIEEAKAKAADVISDVRHCQELEKEKVIKCLQQLPDNPQEQ